MYKKVQNNYPTLIGGTLFPGQYACTIDSQSPYQQNHSQLKLTMKKKQDKYNYEHPYCTDRYIVVSLSSDKWTNCLACVLIKSLWIKASDKCPKCKRKCFSEKPFSEI